MAPPRLQFGRDAAFIAASGAALGARGVATVPALAILAGFGAVVWLASCAWPGQVACDPPDSPARLAADVVAGLGGWALGAAVGAVVK